MISHLGFMPGGNALKSHLTEAGFALDSVHDDFEVGYGADEPPVLTRAQIATLVAALGGP